MKNLITLIAVVTIALTSCTSTKNSIVMKRKYNKGFYVAHNHKKNNVESIAKVTENTVVKSKTEIATPVIESIAPKVVSLSLANASAEVKSAEITSFPKMVEMKHNTIVSDSKNVTASATQTKIKASHKKINSVKSTKSKGGSDSQLILLVILSLFPILALIAIYLKDGKQVTLNFWIDLILHFIFLYWLFALLVVLDVINLA